MHPVRALGLLICAILVGLTEQVSAQDQSVIEQHVRAHGGCALMAKWEQEFRRSDQTPFGKPIDQLNDADYQTIRRLVESCLDPFSASPGRRELVMSNVDSRLSGIRKSRRDQAASNAERQKHVDAAVKRRQDIEDLRLQFNTELPKYLEELARYDDAVAKFLASSKNVELDSLDRVLAQAWPVVDLANKAIASRSPSIQILKALERLYVREGGVPSVETSFLERRINELRTLKSEFQKCGASLRNIGVPELFIRMRVQSDWIEQDHPYLFQLICPDPGDVRVSKPSWLSRYLTFEGRSGNLILDFETPKNADKLASSDPKNRLIARRLRTRTEDLQADTNLEAGALASRAFFLFIEN